MTARSMNGVDGAGRASTRRAVIGLKPDLRGQKGFTLVEMIVVIVITGIIAGIVAIFIQAPVQGYFDSARRAELTDIADTAVRRLARDVRMAVPNSVRQSNCTMPCVEFIPTKDGGRYRAGSGGSNDVLEFGVNDGSFEIIGPAIDFAAGDYIVVGSTQSNAVPPYDQTSNGVLRAYTGQPGLQTVVHFTNTALPFWAELPSQRFDVVDGTQQAVTYQCENVGTDGAGNGTGVLRRYWHYGFNNPPGGSSAILADKVSDCSIKYDQPNQRVGLLTVLLEIKEADEAVRLYNEIHVNNAP